MESTAFPTALQRIFLNFLVSASEMFVSDYAGCVPLGFFFPRYPPVICLCKGSMLLSYEKSINLTNNKLLHLPQVQRFGEVTENFCRKNEKNCGKGFKKNRPYTFNCLGVNVYPLIWQTTYLVLLLLQAV